MAKKKESGTVKDLFEKGLAIRREVLGADYVDKAIREADEITRAMQELLIPA